MSEECGPEEVSTAEKVLLKVREKLKSDVPMETVYDVDCPTCATNFKMLTHEFSCPNCKTIAVVVPCAADDPSNIQFVKV